MRQERENQCCQWKQDDAFINSVPMLQVVFVEWVLMRVTQVLRRSRSMVSQVMKDINLDEFLGFAYCCVCGPTA